MFPAYAYRDESSRPAVPCMGKGVVIWVYCFEVVVVVGVVDFFLTAAWVSFFDTPVPVPVPAVTADRGDVTVRGDPGDTCDAYA